MKLFEAYAGDIVVVSIDRALRWFLVGNFLGPGKGGKGEVSSAIVHELDPETLCEPPGLVYPLVVSHMLDVVAVVARGIALRAMRVRWFHRASRPDVGVTMHDEGNEVDPMLGGSRRGRNPWR